MNFVEEYFKLQYYATIASWVYAAVIVVVLVVLIGRHVIRDEIERYKRRK